MDVLDVGYSIRYNCLAQMLAPRRRKERRLDVCYRVKKFSRSVAKAKIRLLCLANQSEALNIYPQQDAQHLDVIVCKETRPTAGGRDKVEIAREYVMVMVGGGHNFY